MAEDMHICVKTLTGNIIALDIKTTDLADEVKRKIQDKEGIFVGQQRLTYAGRTLHNSQGLESRATIQLSLNLLGGSAAEEEDAARRSRWTQLAKAAEIQVKDQEKQVQAREDAARRLAVVKHAAAKIKLHHMSIGEVAEVRSRNRDKKCF